MSLLRTASRVAVASSVHGKVQRRQRDRWAAEDQRPPAPTPTPAPVPVAPAPAPAPGPSLDTVPDVEQRIALVRQLAELQASGVLTPEEFAAQKARVLG